MNQRGGGRSLPQKRRGNCCCYCLQSILDQILSIVNFGLLLIGLGLLVYSLYLLRLKSYHLDVLACVLLYTGGMNCLFGVGYILGGNNSRCFLMTYAFHIFMIVCAQGSVYFLYLTPEWHRWVSQHVFVAPRWLGRAIKGHMYAAKTGLLCTLVLEVCLLVFSCCLFTYCDSKFLPGGVDDDDDELLYDDDDLGDSIEEAERLLDEEEEEYRDDHWGDRQKKKYSHRHSDLFSKYGLTNDPNTIGPGRRGRGRRGYQQTQGDYNDEFGSLNR